MTATGAKRKEQSGRPSSGCHQVSSDRTRAALAAAKARGASLGGDRGYRPPAPPCAANAASVRAEEADRTAYRVQIEIERLRRDGTTTLVGLARELTALGVPTPRRGCAWTIHDSGAGYGADAGRRLTLYWCRGRRRPVGTSSEVPYQANFDLGQALSSLSDEYDTAHQTGHAGFGL